jgi:transporter family protein
LLVIAQGFFLAFGNLAILLAFASQGKASIIAPLAALYPVVSVPIAIIFLGEKIGAREGLGIFLALASVAALSCETRPPENPHAADASKQESVT